MLTLTIPKTTLPEMIASAGRSLRDEYPEVMEPIGFQWQDYMIVQLVKYEETATEISLVYQSKIISKEEI